ncbi:pyridoxamine 5'-phosphate oxidase family protein [Geodermatophilus sp. SYSU D01176]
MTGPETRDDRAALEEIPVDECYRLLRTQQVGRLAVNGEHHPLVFPVNYGMDGDTIVIRTAPGTKLSAAAHANVTFEVDQIDQFARRGWSVLVRALAEEVTDAHGPDLVRRTHATDVRPWAPGEHGHWLRLIPHDVTGRRIVPGELPPPVDPRAYL